MDENKLARDNHAFYYVAVGMNLCQDEFKAAALHSFDEPAQYGVETADYSGYIRVDCTEIKKQHDEVLERRVRQDIREGLFGAVACKLARAISGPLNTEAHVRDGMYCFDFQITQYERDKAHHFEPVEDPLPLPEDERIGRLVELKVSVDLTTQ